MGDCNDAQTRASHTVGRAIDELNSILVEAAGGEYGRHGGSFNVEGSDAKMMIFDYLEQVYEEDGASFEWTENATEFLMDQKKAGTMTAEAVKQGIAGEIKRWFAVFGGTNRNGGDATEEQLDAWAKRAQHAVDHIAEAGAIFGFDGFNQNLCASPTAMMLVVDVEAHKIHAIDLNPCTEG